MTQASTLRRNWLSSSSPAFTAGAMGSVLGVAMMFFGFWLISKTTAASTTLAIAIIVVGAIELASSFFTLRGMRVAWAFAMSINGTAALVFLFSAPRIRDATGLGLEVAGLPSLTFTVIVILCALSSDKF